MSSSLLTFSSSSVDEIALRRFARSLYLRLGEAVLLKRADATVGAWTPKKHDCHENVAHWVEHNPRHKHVFGFVYFDLRYFGFVQFAAHSAIEVEDGSLVDITPHDASADYPFIRHTGTFEEFAAFAAVGKVDVPVEELP